MQLHFNKTFSWLVIDLFHAEFVKINLVSSANANSLYFGFMDPYMIRLLTNVILNSYYGLSEHGAAAAATINTQ